MLGVLCSKLFKFTIKNFENHTVASEAGTFDNLIFPIKDNLILGKLVEAVVNEQKRNSSYDYICHEQKTIDKLVYEMYGLNKDDAREVETWYARRYPKLARFAEIK